MNREEMLDECKEIVTKHRQSCYGTPEDNFGVIADMWGAYLGRKIERHDVAVLMILLKVARSRNSPTKEDHYIDMAGYAACACEVATKGQSKEQEGQESDDSGNS